jgi:predicted amidohydrolase YtcJ
VEVGGTDEILWLREPEHEIVDLEGRTVLPGFVDPHNRFSIGALECFWADCRGAPSIEAIQRALAAAAPGTPAGECSPLPASPAPRPIHPGARSRATSPASRRACSSSAR